MAIFPVRQLGRTGIIRDVAPYDLPVESWSSGKNVRFQNGAVERYDVIAKVLDETAVGDPPAGLVSILSDTNQDSIILVDDNFVLRESIGTVVNDVTVAGHTPSISTAQITSTHLGGVTYINRPANVPVFRLSTAGGAFANLTNWDATWRCQALRSYKDYLIAINVTKGATNYPGMVKWSNATLGGAVPDTWDPLAVGSLAGENILNDIIGSLVDGGTLRNAFVIYSRKQVFLMEADGSDFVFSFRKTFDDDGIIAPNCWIEVNGKHYVFGSSDIYVHDGISKQSLTEGRVRDYIYDNLNRDEKNRCFVFHHETENEIVFAYPSISGDVAVSGVTYCNYAAVYNYVENNWTFIDLPNVSAAAYGSVSKALIWSAATQPWSAMGTSWNGLQDVKRRTVNLAGRGYGSVLEALYALDPLVGGSLSYLILAETFYQPFVQRDKIDLDNLGLDIEQKKLLRMILPQITKLRDNSIVRFTFGYSNNPTEPVTWLNSITFDPETQHKIDLRHHHRYLSMKYEVDSAGDANFYGMDMDILPLSRR